MLKDGSRFLSDLLLAFRSWMFRNTNIATKNDGFQVRNLLFQGGRHFQVLCLGRVKKKVQEFRGTDPHL